MSDTQNDDDQIINEYGFKDSNDALSKFCQLVINGKITITSAVEYYRDKKNAKKKITFMYESRR